MPMSLPEPLTADTASITHRPEFHGGKERIKVVFVIDNMRFGGTELNAVRTAERLHRERFDLQVVCLSGEGPLSERYRASGIPVTNLGLRSFYGPSMFTSGWRFVRLLRKGGVDVVHAHDMYSNIFVAAWGRLAGARVVITSRRWWTSVPNWKLKFGSRFAVARSTAILANSSAVAELVMSESPEANGKVWTVTNFADDDAFGVASDAERAQRREDWNTPDGAVVIGCVSRLDPLKDHATLLRAFALLRSRHPDAFLVLIGDGDCRDALEELALELEIEDSVHLAGEIRDRGNLHRGFDVSVLTSLSEGFPNTLVEAMAAGRPVVATAVGGCVDAVVDGETGLLVQAGNVTAVADALSRLIADPLLRCDLGRAAMRRASELYSAAAAVGRIQRMYIDLLTREAVMTAQRAAS